MHARDESSYDTSAARDRDDGSAREELQRFERVLAEVSAGFINIPAAQVDVAITEALRRIARLLDVDRITLLRAAPDGALVVTHSGSVDGVPEVRSNHVPSYPWTFGELRANRHVAFEVVDDLPAEADVDKANWRRINVHSNLTMPIMVAGVFEGVLALACLRRTRTWPSELVGRIRVLAGILGNALGHKRALIELGAALRFERLMSQALAGLMTARRADLDQVITSSLRDAAEVLGAGRATLWQRTAGEFELLKTHRWLAPGMPPPPDVAGSGRLPWITSELFAGRAVLGSLADLPPQAASDLPVLRQLRSHSFVAVPLSFGGEIAGALSFASESEDPAWPQSLVPRVQLFGELLSSVLARARAETRESEARAEAVHAARLGTMGVVAASLAHELTQPLAAILSNAETAICLLAADDLDRAELRSTIEDILADDHRAGGLIHQLRRFLRRDEFDRAELDVRDVLDEVLALVRGEALGKSVSVTLESEPGLPPVVGNHAQIQQVMLNLLLNAFDAVAGNPASGRRVGVTASNAQDRVVITVADNGAGMDTEILQRAFSPFFTTKAKGMGLGLSISRSIAESHGGTLDVRSRPGSGSAFAFSLPKAPASA